MRTYSKFCVNFKFLMIIIMIKKKRRHSQIEISICEQSSFLIAMTLERTSKALGSPDGLIKIGVIIVPWN